MNNKSDEEREAFDSRSNETNRKDNRAWALKWDGAALAAMRQKSGDKDKWDRP
ncbi:MAG: hypothetical protein U9Q94_09275 [Candidatus Bipolaricaulota bacterium]|nr:hypothetical protein [Candidatus Bipolaricaulota bacterium]